MSSYVNDNTEKPVVFTRKPIKKPHQFNDAVLISEVNELFHHLVTTFDKCC